MNSLKCLPDMCLSDGSIGPSNVYCAFDLSSGSNGQNGVSNGQVECFNGHFDWVYMGKIYYIKTYILALLTACWCPLDPKVTLGTRMFIGHLTCPVDPVDKGNVQCTFQLCFYKGKYNT